MSELTVEEFQLIVAEDGLTGSDRVGLIVVIGFPFALVLFLFKQVQAGSSTILQCDFCKQELK